MLKGLDRAILLNNFLNQLIDNFKNTHSYVKPRDYMIVGGQLAFYKQVVFA